MQFLLPYPAERRSKRQNCAQCDILRVAPTPQQSRQRTTPADPRRLPAEGSGTKPPNTPSSAKLGRPHTRPRPTPLPPPPRYFPNSVTPEVVFGKQSYLHDDLGTAIPSNTPDSPAPGEKTKDIQSTPQAPLCTGGGGRNRAKPEPRRKSRGGHSAPEPPKRRRGAPSGLASPANPATYTARQFPVPIVGTRRSFPSPTMTPFLSEKKLTTSPGAGAGPTVLPEGLRARPSGSAPPKGCAAPRPSRNRPGLEGPGVGGPRRGQAGRRRAAGRTDPPRNLCPRPVLRRTPDKCERDPRPPGRGDSQRTERPGGGTATRAGPGPPPRPVCGRRAGGRFGLGNGTGGGGSREAEAPNPGARRDHRAIFPRSSAGPSDSRKDPLTRPRKPQKMSLPSLEASSDPGTSRVPSPTPPQNQQARGRDGGRRAAGPAVAEAEAPAPPPPAAATGTFVWRPLGLPRWGEGGTTKNPSRTGGPGPESRCPPEDGGARPSAAPSGQRSRRWPWRRQA